MMFSITTYGRLKSRLRLKYTRELGLTVRELRKLKPSKIQGWFFIQRDEFKEFTPFKWYFLKQIQSFAYFQKHELTQRPSLEDELSPEEDALFERWNKSEFADYFLKFLNQGHSVGRASARTLTILDQHLVTLGERHLLRTKKLHKSYRVQTSLGEMLKDKSPVRLLETTMHLEGKELGLMTSSLKEMKSFSHRIEIALKVIKKFSPSSWERFKSFTELIIPIGQKEFVSYSHQDLPGSSMINLYHRDFVDLMDDLIHENGHHHLNYYLNLGKLIQEPADYIYYSPWRQSFRPLRGIYHAYFTFGWAFKLFSDLALAKELDSIWYLFSKEEKEKIYFRAIEEYWMLDYSFRDLQWAKKHGLINEMGWKLVKAQKAQMDKLKKKIPEWEKKLRGRKKDLKELKRSLKLNGNHPAQLASDWQA